LKAGDFAVLLKLMLHGWLETAIERSHGPHWLKRSVLRISAFAIAVQGSAWMRPGWAEHASVTVNTGTCERLSYCLSVGIMTTRSNSPMQLTRAADYGVRVMIHLARLTDGHRASLPELARAIGAPASFLSKVLQALCRAGLIDSRRGQSGGFVMLRLGAGATLYEVVEAIDGPICLNVCLAAGESCSRRSRCPARPVWVEAQHAVIRVLCSVTNAELATGQTGFPAVEEAGASNVPPTVPMARSDREDAHRTPPFGRDRQ
jgi:Rrf2 family protein